VTVIILDKPGEDRIYLFCRATPIQATRLLRAWSRRNLIEQVFRILKHLLATEACQVHSEDAYYGHLVLRLIASLILYHTSRVIFNTCTGYFFAFFLLLSSNESTLCRIDW
jgi:transposase